MYTIYTTKVFETWFDSLNDRQTARRIQARIDRVEEGNFGDHQTVGQGVFELRVHHGPGWRVYFTKQDLEIVVLLVGGNKSSQRQDIATAQDLARQLKR